MKKILVVEDDKYLRGAFVVKLSTVGFEVRAAADGQEAIDMLNEFTPDLIILDLIMPKKDGYAVLEELKNNEKWIDIPVMITTNLGQQGDIDKGRMLGAEDYIIKSDMTIDDIVTKIKIKLGL